MEGELSLRREALRDVPVGEPDCLSRESRAAKARRNQQLKRKQKDHEPVKWCRVSGSRDEKLNYEHESKSQGQK